MISGSHVRVIEDDNYIGATTESCNLPKLQHCFKTLFTVTWNVTVDHDQCRDEEFREPLECTRAQLETCGASLGPFKLQSINRHGELLKRVFDTSCDAGPLPSDSTCDLHTAGQCLHDYFYILTHGDLGTICSQAQVTLTCLEPLLNQCSGVARFLVGLVTDETHWISDLMCSQVTCRPDMAQQCLQTAFESLKYPVSIATGSSLVCRSLQLSLTCVANHTAMCSQGELPAYVVAGSYQLYQYMSTECAGWDSSNTLIIEQSPEFLAPVVLATMATNHWLSVDAVCSLFNMTILQAAGQGQNLMSYTSDLLLWQHLISLTLDKYSDTCFDQKVPDCSWLEKVATQSPVCDQVMARQCVDMVLLSKLVLDVSLRNRNWEEICKVGYNMIACAQLHLSNCFEASAEINKLTQEIEGLVGYECSQIGVPDSSVQCGAIQDACNTVDAWLTCSNILTADTDMCMHINDLYTCFHDNTHGCNSAAAAPIEFFLHWFLTGCPETRNQSMTLFADDSLQAVAQCSLQLGYNLNDALLTYQGASLMLCTGLGVYDLCVASATIPSLVHTYRDQFSQSYIQYRQAVCNASLGTTAQPFNTEESTSCQYDKAIREVTLNALFLYNLPYVSLAEQQQICGIFPTLRERLLPLVTECSVARRGQISDTVDSLHQLFTELCSHTHTNMQRSCDTQKVKMCLHDFGGFSYSAHSDADVCSKLHETFDCLHNHARECDDEFQSSLTQEIKSIYSIMGNLSCDTMEWCNRDTQTDWELAVCQPPLQSCDLFRWKTCVTDPNVYYNCQDMPGAQSCILASLEGCDPTQYVWAQSQMYQFQQQMGTSCGFIPAPPAFVQQIHFNINQCSNYISQAQDVTKQGLCTAIGNYYNCIDALDHSEIPIVWQGILVRNGLLWGKEAYLDCIYLDGINFLVGPDFDRNDFEGSQCSSVDGQLCLRSLVQVAVTESHMIPISGRMEACNSIENYKTCVVQQTSGCTSDLERTMITSSYWVMEGVANMGVCSDGTRNRTCKPEAAMDCMADLGQELLKDGSHGNQKHACSKLLPTNLCVRKHISGCDYVRRTEIEETFRQLSAIVRRFCSQEPTSDFRPCYVPGEATLCDLEQALTCMVPVQANLLQGLPGQQMCNGIPEMQQCIQKSSSGCDNATASIIQNRVQLLMRRFGDYCPQLYCDECTARMCLTQLHNSLQYEHIDICSSMNVAHQCIYDNTHHCATALGEKLLQEVTLIVGDQAQICETTLPSCLQMYMMQVYQILDYTPTTTFTWTNATSNLDPVVLAMCSKATKALQCVTYHINQTEGIQHLIMNETIQRIGRMVKPKCQGVTNVQCYSCDNATSNEECNIQPAQACPRDLQMCSTTVTVSTVTKGCVHPDDCEQTCSGDSCSFCCHGNLCNQPVDHVLIEPQSCQPRTALWCGFQLLSAMAESESLPCSELESAINCMVVNTEMCHYGDNMIFGLLGQELLHNGAVQSCLSINPACTCGQCSSVLLLSALTTPQNNVQEYCSSVQDMFNKTLSELDFRVCNLATMQSTIYNLNIVANYMDGMCSLATETCNYYGEVYMHGASFKAQDGCNTCSCNHGYLQCTLMYCHDTTYKCPSVDPGQTGTCVEMCSGDEDCEGNQLCCSNGCGHTCQEPVPAESDCVYGNKSIRSSESFLAQDGCNYCHCNDGDVSCTEMFCTDTDSVPATCDLDGVQTCIQKADLPSLLTGFGNNLCMAAVTMLHCIEHKVTYCPTEVVTMVTNNVLMTLNPVMPHCDIASMLTAYYNMMPHDHDVVNPPHGTCSVLDAVRCITEMEKGDKSCSDLQHVADCVYNSTAGCAMVDVVPVWFNLQQILENTDCDLHLNDPSTRDPLYPIAACTLEFGHSLSHQLSQSYLPLTGGMCDTIQKYVQCLHASNTSSLGRMYTSNLLASMSNLIQMCSTHQHTDVQTSSSCHYCQYGTSLEECDAREPDRCYDNQVCSTILHYDIYNGAAMVTKGCADISWCQQWSGCNPQSLACTKCCHGDMCNYGNMTTNVTMATSTPQPKHTTSDHGHDQCDLEPVMEHMVTQFLMLMTLNTAPGSQRHAICQYLTQGVEVMLHDLDPDCSQEATEHVQTVSQMLSSWTATECPIEPVEDTCWEAALCVARVIGFGPDQNATCRAIAEARDCMLEHADLCTGAGRRSLNTSLNLLADINQVLCVPNMLDNYQVPSCVDVTVETDVCNEDKATECLQSLQQAWQNPFMTRNHFCRLRKTALKCIHDNLNGCEGPVTLTSVVMEVIHETEMMCSDTWCPGEDKCQLQQASNCLHNLAQMIVAASNVLDHQEPGLCRNLTWAHHCVMNATEGCHEEDRKVLIQEFSALTYFISPSCESPPTNPTQCLSSFHTGLDTILKLEEELIISILKNENSSFGGLNLPGGMFAQSENDGRVIGYGINLPGYNSFHMDPLVTAAYILLEQYSLNMTQLQNFILQQPQTVHNALHQQRYLCHELSEAFKCFHSYIKKRSRSDSFVTDSSLQVLEKFAADVCQDQTCHSCSGLSSNSECNSQPPSTCSPLQVCQTKVHSGLYYKGCVPVLDCQQNCDENRGPCYCCRGNICNQYPTAVTQGACQVQIAVDAAFNLLMKSLDGNVSNADLQNSSVAMVSSTGGCYGDAYVSFNILGQRLKSYVEARECSKFGQNDSCVTSGLDRVVVMVTNSYQTPVSKMKICRQFDSILEDINTQQEQNGGCCRNRSTLVTTVLSLYNQIQGSCDTGPNLNPICQLISDWPCADEEDDVARGDFAVISSLCRNVESGSKLEETKCAVHVAMETCWNGALSHVEINCTQFRALTPSTSTSCIEAGTSACSQNQLVPFSLLQQSILQFCDLPPTPPAETGQSWQSPVSVCLRPLASLPYIMSYQSDVCASAIETVGGAISCLQTSDLATPYLNGLVSRLDGLIKKFCEDQPLTPPASECVLCRDVCTNVSAATMCPNFPTAFCVPDCGSCEKTWYFRGDNVTHLCETETEAECPVESISQSLSMWSSLLVTYPLMSRDDRQVLCSRESLLKDLSDDISMCSSYYRSTFLTVLQWIQDEVKVICPVNDLLDVCETPQCDVTMATYQMGLLGYSLATNAFSDHVFCQHIEIASQSVSCLLHNCSDADLEDIQMTLTFIRSHVQGRCPLLASSLLCGNLNSNETRVADDMMPDSSGMCDVEQAKWCTMSVNLPPESHPDYCMQMMAAVANLSECISPLVADCDTEEQHEIQSYYKSIFSQRAPVCGEDYLSRLFKMEESCDHQSCSFDKMMNCTQYLQFNMTGCGNLPTVLHCGSTALAGCNPLQKLALNTTFFKSIEEKGVPMSCIENWMIDIRPTVTSSADPLTVAAASVYDCVSQFHDRVEKRLTTDSTKSVCDISLSLMKCYEAVMETPDLPVIVFQTMTYLTVEGKQALTFACSDKALEVKSSISSCNPTGALSCLRQLSTNVLLGPLMPKDGKAAFCQSLLHNTSCLSRSLESCSDDNGVIVKQLYEILQSVSQLSGTCSPQVFICKPEDAVYCISQLAEHVQDHGQTVYSHQVCRSMEQTEACIRQMTGTCDERTKQTIMETLEPVRCRAQSICPSSIHAGHPTQGAIQTCVTSADSVLHQDSQKCNPARAVSCLQDVLGEADDTLGYSSQTLCSSYTKALKCFLTNIQDCTEVSRFMALSLLLPVTEKVNPGCEPVIQATCGTEEKAGCSHEKLEACATNFISAVSTGNNVCLALEEVEHCVKMNSRLCTNLSLMLTQARLLRLKQMTLTNFPNLQCEELQTCSQGYLHQVASLLDIAQENEVNIVSSQSWSSSCFNDGVEDELQNELIYRCQARGAHLSCSQSFIEAAHVPGDVAMAIRSTVEQLDGLVSTICEAAVYGPPPMSGCNVACATCLIQHSGLQNNLPWLLSLVHANSTESSPLVNSFTFCRQYDEHITKLSEFVTSPSCHGDNKSLAWYAGHLENLNTLFGQYCSRECNTTLADVCLAPFLTVIQQASTSNNEEVCSVYESTVACVEKSLSPCEEDITVSVISDIRSSLDTSGVVCVTWPEIQVRSSSLELRQDGNPVTVEVVLASPTSANEQVQVIVTDAGTSTCASGEVTPQIMTDSCSLILDEAEEIQTISLYSHIDHKKSSRQNVSVSLSAQLWRDGAVVASRMMQQVDLVAIETGTVGICYLISEPQIISFDGLPFYAFGQGEYVLYEHRSLNQKVHVGFQRCTQSSTETCPCVVMVMSGDDVFVVDKCRRRGENKHALEFRVYQNNEMTPNTHVFRSTNSKKFKFVLPSGTIVSVEKANKLLDVWVKTSQLDWDKTDGLCGLYDGNQNTDFLMPDGTSQDVTKTTVWEGALLPSDFVTAWRADSSLFLGTVPGPSLVTADYTKCDCSQEPGTCVPTDLISTCDIIEKDEQLLTDLSPYMQTNDNAVRKKRQTNSIWDEIDVDENFSPNLKTWPTPSGITEADAIQACESTIMNAEFWDICKVAINTTVTINSCVTSILLNDNLDARIDAYEAMKVSCLLAVVSDPSIAVSLNTDYKSLIAYLSNFTCLNDCNGHGLCINDTCICDDGYVTVDCSVTIATAPEVLSLSEQIYSEPVPMTTVVTRKVDIYGDGFLNTASLTCHLDQLQLEGQGFSTTGTETKTSATFLTSGHVKCDLTGALPITGVMVSVSNNGQNQSNSLLYIMQDPVCYNCDAEQAQCQKQTTSCLIDGRCYPAATFNPEDSCLLCSPVTNQWTYKTSEACPPQTTEPPVTTTPKPQTTTSESSSSQPSSTVSPNVTSTSEPTTATSTPEVTTKRSTLVTTTATPTQEVTTKQTTPGPSTAGSTTKVTTDLPSSPTTPVATTPGGGENNGQQGDTEDEDKNESRTLGVIIGASALGVVLLIAVVCVGVRNKRRYDGLASSSSSGSEVPRKGHGDGSPRLAKGQGNPAFDGHEEPQPLVKSQSNVPPVRFVPFNPSGLAGDAGIYSREPEGPSMIDSNVYQVNMSMYEEQQARSRREPDTAPVYVVQATTATPGYQIPQPQIETTGYPIYDNAAGVRAADEPQPDYAESDLSGSSTRL